MNMLCADTSSKNLSFTLVKYIESMESSCDVELLCHTVIPTDGKMNELFFSYLSDFLLKAGVEADAINRWVCISGPGSFTGIRIGMAALAGISAGFGVPLYGLGAHEAAAILSAKDKGQVAIKLKGDEFAVKEFNFSDMSNCFSEFNVLRYSMLSDECIIANSGQQDNISFALSYAITNRLAQQFLANATPIYVRKSEAELNFDKISATL